VNKKTKKVLLNVIAVFLIILVVAGFPLFMYAVYRSLFASLIFLLILIGLLAIVFIGSKLRHRSRSVKRRSRK